MSGHSKWHTIKHKKGALDAKRGKIFTRIIKELSVAARSGGGDPAMNPRLRTVIAEAKSVNMPNDNITRAIRRGTGEEEGVNYEEITYEGYGPGGAAVIVETLTDNRNRTGSEVRHAFTKHNGSLGEPGSVAYLFDKRGVIVVDASRYSEDDLMPAIEAGAEDISVDDDVYEVVTEPAAFLEGVSLWPTQILRLTALVLNVVFLTVVHYRLRTVARDLTARFFPGCAGPAALVLAADPAQPVGWRGLLHPAELRRIFTGLSPSQAPEASAPAGWSGMPTMASHS